MRRHARTGLGSPFCLIDVLPSLFLLAALLAAASGALLPQSPRILPYLSRQGDLSSVARVQPQTVHRCIPRGKGYIFGVTADVRCPCLVRFSLKRIQGRASRKRLVDFLIVTSEEAEKVRQEPERNISYIEKYSITEAKVNPATRNGLPEYVSPGFEISEDAAFALVIRTSFPRRDCGLSVTYVLEPVPVQCPIRLGKKENAPIGVTESNNETVLTPLVVGGAPATNRHQSFMVSFVRGESLFCSGSYVAPGWVLSAAHCRIEVGDKAFVAGERGFKGALRDIARIVPHPSFDFSKTNGPFDIALVQLRGPFVSDAVPLPINSRANLPAEMSYVRIAGYGRISEGFASFDPPSLRTVDLPVVPMTKCKQEYDAGLVDLPVPLNPSVQLCAGYIRGECDACQGDSGGPVVVFDSQGGPVQVGIVSFGMGCARGGIPGVYTRIAPFVQWMQSVAGTVQTSASGTVVIANSLEADVNESAPLSGIGFDGIDADRLRSNEIQEIRGERRIARLLQVIVPSVVGGVTVFFFSVACVVCFAASRYRDRTLSDHATGKRTKTMGADSSNPGGGVSSVAESGSGFGAYPPLSSPTRLAPQPPQSPQPPPEVWISPRKKFSFRKKQQEIIRMPEVGTEEESSRAVAGAARVYDEQDEESEEEVEVTREIRPEERMGSRRKSKRNSGRSLQAEILEEEEGDYDQLQEGQAEPLSAERIEELGRQRRNELFEERYPTIQQSRSNFLMPGFDEIEPERTQSRPNMPFRADLHEQTFDR